MPKREPKPFDSLTGKLNGRQRAAVETTTGPLLIIAGAGSGKTRVITQRIARLLAEGVAGKTILALTFTNKAAKEMRERVRLLSDPTRSAPPISTFHSFGVQILREWITLLGFGRDFSIYDQIDKMSLLKEIAREVLGARNDVDLYSCAQTISAVKTGRTEWNAENDLYRPVADVYREHLRAYNAVDFDDLIVLPLELFERHSQVLDALRERYRYVMVDEFQDTSTAQYRIVEAVARKHRNLCVVGDDDQSIYSWRGASSLNMAYFERDFPERREIKLEQNYRSAHDILRAANSVIAHNRNRKQKELWTGLRADRCIEVFFPADEYEEARFIARTVRAIAGRGGVRLDKFGILVRTNSLIAPIEEALLGENIAYRVSGGTSFFQRKEIKDIIAYLKLIANPDDNVSLLRVVNTPRRGIGRKTVQMLRELSAERRESLYSTIQALIHAEDGRVSFKTRERLEEFVGIIEPYRAEFLAPRKLAEKLGRLIDDLNIRGHIVSEHPDNERPARLKFRSVMRFVDMMSAWENDPDVVAPTLFDFLARIALVNRDDNQEESDRRSVHLMTIHAAKGLEFDVVFLAGVEDGLIPHARALEEDESNIEEERRLFYVAITRAKRKLLLSACRTRRVMREVQERAASPFLDEIPDELIHVHEPDEPVEQRDAGSFFDQIRARLGLGRSDCRKRSPTPCVYRSRMIISTRRFFARFSSESFGATGSLPPFPV